MAASAASTRTIRIWPSGTPASSSVKASEGEESQCNHYARASVELRRPSTSASRGGGVGEGRKGKGKGKGTGTGRRRERRKGGGLGRPPAADGRRHDANVKRARRATLALAVETRVLAALGTHTAVLSCRALCCGPGSDFLLFLDDFVGRSLADHAGGGRGELYKAPPAVLAADAAR